MEQQCDKDIFMLCRVSASFDYSVFLTPPIMAGLQSAAHLARELNTRLIPISLGFSRPRLARCFITLTNSLKQKIIKHCIY